MFYWKNYNVDNNFDVLIRYQSLLPHTHTQKVILPSTYLLLFLIVLPSPVYGDSFYGIIKFFVQPAKNVLPHEYISLCVRIYLCTHM